jgi:hypothetical protein
LFVRPQLYGPVKIVQKQAELLVFEFRKLKMKSLRWLIVAKDHNAMPPGKIETGNLNACFDRPGD